MATIELDDITKLGTFLEREDATRLFSEIIKEITWLQCEWFTASCATSYLYGGREKSLTPKASLDDLTCIVETVLETKVVKMWLWCYGDGREHLCYRSICADNNILHLFIGTTRKIYLRHRNNPAQMYSMRHGDALYIPRKINSPRLHVHVPMNDNITSCTIHIALIIEDPYSFRHRNIGRIHLLGQGPMDVTYDMRTYPDGIPNNLTAVTLPSPHDSDIDNINLLIRPPYNASFIQESLQFWLEEDQT